MLLQCTRIAILVVMYYYKFALAAASRGKANILQ